MRFEEFRDRIRGYLLRHPAGSTWPELKAQLGLPQRTPCYTWVYRLEEEIGLHRRPGPLGMVWYLVR